MECKKDVSDEWNNGNQLNSDDRNKLLRNECMFNDPQNKQYALKVFCEMVPDPNGGTTKTLDYLLVDFYDDIKTCKDTQTDAKIYNKVSTG